MLLTGAQTWLSVELGDGGDILVVVVVQLIHVITAFRRTRTVICSVQ